MMNVKSLALAACVIAGISFAATGYAGKQCDANGNAQVTCPIGSHITLTPGACNWAFNDTKQFVYASCKSGATPSFACGNRTPFSVSAGTWILNMESYKITCNNR